MIDQYIQDFTMNFPMMSGNNPWHIVRDLPKYITATIKSLTDDFIINGDVAIHKDSVVEQHVVLKGPIIISRGCFVGAHAYLRGGVFIGPGVSIGPGCEIKTSLITGHSALAHFNFVGDSILGSNVNMEAGSIVANHHNDRVDKTIHVVIDNMRVTTDVTKFGALIGDNCKIGANAVLSPGTILSPATIVKRLELVQQA